MSKSVTASAAFLCLLFPVSAGIAETMNLVDLSIKGRKKVELKVDCTTRTFCIPGQPCDESCKNLKATLQTTPSGINVLIEGIDEGDLSITTPEK